MFIRMVRESAVTSRVERMQAYDVGLKNMEQLQVLIQLKQNSLKTSTM
jgi:hypothetical protein